jgi:hypothetical protein
MLKNAKEVIDETYLNYFVRLNDQVQAASKRGEFSVRSSLPSSLVLRLRMELSSYGYRMKGVQAFTESETVFFDITWAEPQEIKEDTSLNR